jgi:phospholipid transport system substrate-binding protein
MEEKDRGNTVGKEMMGKSLYAFVVIVVLSQSAAVADENLAAEEFLKVKLDQVVAVLKKKDLRQEEKSKEIVEIVTPMFDFPLMAKLSLGRENWFRLTDAEKQKFKGLFVKRLRQSYLDQLTSYTDETIRFEPPVEVGQKIHVPTRLISKTNNISLRYKLYKSDAGWRIYDIEIQGVSIIRSYRSQFNEILQTGTVSDLFQRLEEASDH